MEARLEHAVPVELQVHAAEQAERLVVVHAPAPLLRCRPPRLPESRRQDMIEPLRQSTGTRVARGYAGTMAGFWSGLSGTLRALDAIAEDAHRLGEDTLGPLRTLQYRLHWSSELLDGVQPPAGAREGARGARDALADARDATARGGGGDRDRWPRTLRPRSSSSGAVRSSASASRGCASACSPSRRFLGRTAAVPGSRRDAALALARRGRVRRRRSVAIVWPSTGRPA